MNISELHPELQTTAYRLMRSVPFHNKLFYSVISWLQKRGSNKAKPAPGVHVEDRPLADASLRLYRPESGGNGAGLMWIHGGGYIIGDVGICDDTCCRLVKELGLTVVSVDYRLAPKHPFPAALDDCFEAWHALLAGADEWGLDTGRLAIAGDSAGGGLAAAVVQRIADAGGVQPAAQVLLYPMLDDRTAADQSLDAIGHVLWSNRNNRAGWSWYLGQPAGAASVPDYAVPARRENLSGLPPAWIGVGELDLFYREDLEYADRLREAGVVCELHTDPGAPHAYDRMVPDSSLSRGFDASYFTFLRQRLAL